MITSPSKVTEEHSDKIEDDINSEASEAEDRKEGEGNRFHKRVRPFPIDREHPSYPDHIQCGN